MKPDPVAQARHLLATYGADPARWPATARDTIAHLDPQERASQARLDAWLDQSIPPPLPPTLRNTILTAARTAPSRTDLVSVLRDFWYDIGGLRLAAPAFALALVAGVALGHGLLQVPTATASPTEDILNLALLDHDYETLLP